LAEELDKWIHGCGGRASIHKPAARSGKI
jgi:hypothetical protein